MSAGLLQRDYPAAVPVLQRVTLVYCQPAHVCLPAGCSAPACSEIILRPYQFCNLTEVIIREHDDIASLKRKARLATILGTFQVRATSRFVGYIGNLARNLTVHAV
jgi:hypothetical protein